MRKKKLTNTQFDLFQVIYNESGKLENQIFEYYEMKAKANFKSFDNSFNALLFKNYILRVTDNDKNEFKLNPQIINS